MDKNVWRKYYIKNFKRAVMNRLKRSGPSKTLTFKKDLMSLEDANRYIYEKLIEGSAFVAGRFGETEARATADGLGIIYKAKRRPEKARLYTLYNNAGVFPYGKETELRYAECMEKLIPDIDMLFAWQTFMQDYLVDNYLSDKAVLAPLKSAEPYYSDEPWSKGLRGKKVLVIHPFTETIKSQYEKHELLFENKDILPDFELKTLKAVQTIAGQKDERFSDWFEALDHMYNEAMKIDFDVAIIGCGAYGLPLAIRLKLAGKQAIHMGGATQILFGIKGKRWDSHPVISKLYNENWTRPGDSERPKCVENVENGCYW